MAAYLYDRWPGTQTQERDGLETMSAVQVYSSNSTFNCDGGTQET